MTQALPALTSLFPFLKVIVDPLPSALQTIRAPSLTWQDG